MSFILFLSISFFLTICISFSKCPFSFSLSVYFILHVSIFFFIYLFICISFSHCFSLYIFVSVSPINVFHSLPVYQCLSLFTFLYVIIHLSIFVFHSLFDSHIIPLFKYARFSYLLYYDEDKCTNWDIVSQVQNFNVKQPRSISDPNHKSHLRDGPT